MLNNHYRALEQLLKSNREQIYTDWYLPQIDQYIGEENAIIEFMPYDLNRGSGRNTEWRCLVEFVVRVGTKNSFASPSDVFFGVQTHNELVELVREALDGKNFKMSQLLDYEYLANTADDFILINTIRLKRVSPGHTGDKTLVTPMLFSAFLVFSQSRLKVLPESVKPELSINPGQ